MKILTKTVVLMLIVLLYGVGIAYCSDPPAQSKPVVVNQNPDQPAQSVPTKPPVANQTPALPVSSPVQAKPSAVNQNPVPSPVQTTPVTAGQKPAQTAPSAQAKPAPINQAAGTSAVNAIQGSPRPVVNAQIDMNCAVKIALENNVSLRQAAFELAEYRARTNIATSRTRAGMSVNVFGEVSDADNMFATTPTGVMPDAMNMMPAGGGAAVNVMLGVPLFNGGTLNAEIERNRLLEFAYLANIEMQKLDICYRTREAFLQYLLADSQVVISEQALAAQCENVRVTQMLVTTGKFPRFNLLRAQSEAAEAERALIEARNTRNIRMIDLKTIMGINLCSDIKVSDNLASLHPKICLDEALKTALNNRPELKDICYQIQAAASGIRSVRGRYQPQGYLSARYDARAPQTDNFKSGYAAGIVISMPIFDGGERRFMLSEAEATRNRLVVQRDQIRQNIEREVSTAYYSTVSAEEKICAANSALVQSREELRLARLRFSAGRGTYLEVLDAIASWVRAERNYIDAFYEYNINYAQLQRAMGKC